MPLLTERRARPWEIPTGGRGSFESEGHYIGKGSTPFEVAVARSARQPNDGDVRNLWKRRKGNTPSPLLLVVFWPDNESDRVSVCGPGGAEPPVYSDRDPEQIARIALLALDAPDHHAARRLVDDYLPREGGVRNHSLFATHHLIDRVPTRPDWQGLCEQSMPLLTLRRDELVQSLGFTLEPSGQAVLLRADGNARALALFLGEGENPDALSNRFNGMTPMSWVMARATADNVPYVIAEEGDRLRIYSASHRNASSFLELNLPLLTANDAGYLALLFSASSLAEGGQFETLLAESHDFALSLGDRLRNRVYDEAVPAIADALIKKHKENGGATDESTLSALYNRTLLILFRLLFVAYSEDRGLLPLLTNDLYRQRSLKQMSRELADLANEHGATGVPFDAYSESYWNGVCDIWAAVDHGRTEWNVPAYNGGLFTADPQENQDGAALAELSLTNAEFGPCLLGLLTDTGDDGYGPIDFASLDVREFGTIYEGLLESDLAVAPFDLKLTRVKQDDVYVPAVDDDEIVRAEGEVYLHNQSGARKSSGSYFTKPFAVQHLLEHALEPALDAHVERLRVLVETGDEIGAADAFFDFRCIDLSMGSGHFLVSAVDHIERRLSEFLSEHRLAGVLDELDRLEAKATENLEAVGLVTSGTDTNALLRRQIARRCIYGVDLMPTSVELARLALWIHTFVQGLPLTSLNHGLVVGNSLTGIGTLEEALEVLDPQAESGQGSFIRHALETALGKARESLGRFALVGEADRAEVRQARAALHEAEEAAIPAKILCDLALGVRLGETVLPVAFSEQEILKAARDSEATSVATGLGALHFPIAFPEVFLRARPGFDCILGNPPWEKLHVEEHGFWALRFPGLRSMRTGQMDREISRLRELRPDLVAELEQEVERNGVMRHALLRGPYPDLGASHPDLFKAFAWRFWQLVRDAGAIGVVLPRSALSASGLAEWRIHVLEHGTFSDTTMLLNNVGWVFEGVHPQYTVGLVSIRKGDRFVGTLSLNGPFRSRAQFQEGRAPALVQTNEFLPGQQCGFSAAAFS